MSTPAFTTTKLAHRLLGPMLEITFVPAPTLRLLPAEAQSLSRALRAVREGRSAETELFMSPMGCNGYFSANVEADGIAVDAGSAQRLRLDWDAVSALAADLQAFAD